MIKSLFYHWSTEFLMLSSDQTTHRKMQRTFMCSNCFNYIRIPFYRCARSKCVKRQSVLGAFVIMSFSYLYSKWKLSIHFKITSNLGLKCWPLHSHRLTGLKWIFIPGDRCQHYVFISSSVKSGSLCCMRKFESGCLWGIVSTGRGKKTSKQSVKTVFWGGGKTVFEKL